MKISALRTRFHQKLSPLYDPREIDAIFYIYIKYKYNIEKHYYFLYLNYQIGIDVTEINALIKGTPIQYITGKANFCNLEINVNPSVLIPRQETEELVEKIIKIQNSKPNVQDFCSHLASSCRSVRILDLCTGSGVIAITLAKNIKNAEVWATDISEDALKTARENAIQHNVAITFFQHDILNVTTRHAPYLPNNLDIIVANPPYIPYSERSGLHKNVINFEPDIALFVPDKNPLIFYEAIANTAKKILRKGGVLYFETHEKFHSELSTMLGEKDFKEIELLNDINEKPRFASGKKL